MSTEAYGVVAYVKTVMTYMQVIVDFGFTLSATKDIVKAREDRTEMSFVIGDTLLAKLMLGAAGGAGLLILLGSLPLLEGKSGLYVAVLWGSAGINLFIGFPISRPGNHACHHDSIPCDEDHIHGTDFLHGEERCGYVMDSCFGYPGIAGSGLPGIL